MDRPPIRFPLVTDRLLIRPMEIDDAEELLAVYGDIQTMQHLTADVPTDLDGARAWVRSKVELYAADGQLSLWTVVHRGTGRIVGDVGLQHEDHGQGPIVGLGGRGNREFWRLGLGLEAGGAALAAGFTQLGLDRIGAETAPGNLPAQRLLLRLGMEPAGTNPHGWPLFALTRQRWSEGAGAISGSGPLQPETDGE